MSYNTGERVLIVSSTPDRGKDFEELQKKSGALRGQILEAETRLASLTAAVEQASVELKDQESALLREKNLIMDARRRGQELVARAEEQERSARREAEKLLLSAQEKLQMQQAHISSVRDGLGKQEVELRTRIEELDAREIRVKELEQGIVPALEEVEKQKRELAADKVDLQTQHEALRQRQEGVENDKVHLSNLRLAFDSEVVAFETRNKQLIADRVFLKEEEARLGEIQKEIIIQQEAIKTEKQTMISDRENLAILEADVRLLRTNLDRREQQLKVRENALAESLKK